MTWNWESAIRKNRNDLAKIIAGLFVLAGWIPGEERPTFMRRAARNELARLLRVTEAALRRLLVIMATVRKYEVKPAKASARPLPDFSKFGQGKGTRKPVFNLIDPRKPIRFVDEDQFYGKATGGPEPRIWTLDNPVPMFGDCMMRSRNSDLLTPVLLSLSKGTAQDEGEEGTAQDEGFERNFPAYAAAQDEAASRGASASADVEPEATRKANKAADALAENKQTAQDEGEEIKNPSNLLRRLDALDRALKTLPRQARRMARLMEKRKSAQPGSKRVLPIKTGPPPGYREHPKHEADHILRECHGLVCDLRGVP